MNYGYDYGSSGADIAAGVGALVGVIMILFAIALIFAIIGIIGQWKMFKKANEEGWKAIIPVYNVITLCKLVGVTPWWILIVFAAGVLTSIPYLGALVGLVSFSVSIYFIIILSISTARSYNMSDGFGIGYIFNITKPFFYLATGIMESATYVGPKPMADPVWDWLVKTFGGNKNTSSNNVASNNNVSEANVQEENNQSRFCPNCGAQVSKDETFCSSCGGKL